MNMKRLLGTEGVPNYKIVTWFGFVEAVILLALLWTVTGDAAAGFWTVMALFVGIATARVAVIVSRRGRLHR